MAIQSRFDRGPTLPCRWSRPEMRQIATTQNIGRGGGGGEGSFYRHELVCVSSNVRMLQSTHMRAPRHGSRVIKQFYMPIRTPAAKTKFNLNLLHI